MKPIRVRIERALFIGMLLVHASMLSWISFRHSPVSDEMAALAAGIDHWRTGRFFLYNVNPPLVRLVASLPYTCVTDVEPFQYSEEPQNRPAYSLGRQIVVQQGDFGQRVFFFARFVCIPFSMLCAYVCRIWARTIAGPSAGLLAALLWCSSPMALAFGAMITTDVAASAFGTLTAWLLWQWSSEFTIERALFTALSLSICMAIKVTMIVLFPLCVLVVVLSWLSRRALPYREIFCKQIPLILLSPLLFLNLIYGFEGSLQKLGDYQFVSHALGGQANQAGNRFQHSYMGQVPVPLPKHFVMGMDVQKMDFEGGIYWSYLAGQWSQRGWWYYYLYGLAVKTPIGTLLLLGTAVCSMYRAKTPAWCRYWLILPPVLVLVSASSQTGFSHHLRYILPCYPFAMVVIAVAVTDAHAYPLKRFLCTLCVIWSVTSSVFCFPHGIAYFNESVGGPLNGDKHMLVSNLDWGQDFIFAKDWVQRNIGDDTYHVLIDVSFLQPADGGLIGPSVPEASEVLSGQRSLTPGWYLINVGRLRNIGDAHAYLLSLKPKAHAGYSINLYYLDELAIDMLYQSLHRAVANKQ